MLWKKVFWNYFATQINSTLFIIVSTYSFILSLLILKYFYGTKCIKNYPPSTDCSDFCNIVKTISVGNYCSLDFLIMKHFKKYFIPQNYSTPFSTVSIYLFILSRLKVTHFLWNCSIKHWSIPWTYLLWKYFKNISLRKFIFFHQYFQLFIYPLSLRPNLFLCSCFQYTFINPMHLVTMKIFLNYFAPQNNSSFIVLCIYSFILSRLILIYF